MTIGPYLILDFVAPFVLALRSPHTLPAQVWLVLLQKPTVSALVSLAALVLCWRRQHELEWWLLTAAALVVTLAWGESTRVGSDSRDLLIPLLAGLLTWAAIAALRRFHGVEAGSFGAASISGILLLLAVLVQFPEGNMPSSNRLALVSGRPNTTVVEDYTGHPLKDDYPPVTIRNNSLGYRDLEPPLHVAGRTRVLLVGDSYVWGDGIPTAADTLPALLRKRLEVLAPGRFELTSAAFPGLGVYGYRRALERMMPEVHPDIVLVGYLGGADLDPLDVQALRDLLPSQSWLARLVANLRTPQDLHEASVSALADRKWWAGSARESRDALFSVLRGFARQPAHRALLLCYCGEKPRISGVAALVLPPAWRYQGHRSTLWYAKDNHPKPLLNHWLADRLAEELLHPGSGARVTREPNAVDEMAPLVIPAGQESLILAMLGGSFDVAACRLQSATVQSATIQATYDCRARELRSVILQHRPAGPAAIVTRQFAVASSSPAVPRAFLEEVAAHVRAREADFHWAQSRFTQRRTTTRGARPVAGAPSGGFPWRLVVIGACALLVVLAGWRRRPVRSRADTEGGKS